MGEEELMEPDWQGWGGKGGTKERDLDDSKN